MKSSHSFVIVLTAAALAGTARDARGAGPAWVAAAPVTLTPTLDAYAVAQPIGPVALVATVPGVLAGLTVLPGTRVTAQQEIGRLSGPQVALADARAAAALDTARATEQAARATLGADEGLLRQTLATVQGVARDRAALASAVAQVAAALADQTAQQRAETVRSPLAGVVRGVSAADDDTLAAGAVIATIQPAAGAWLQATFYNAGPAEPRPGTRGTFTPSGGGTPVAVVVRGALGYAQADGGVPVALTAEAPLAGGVFGTVTLPLPPVPAITVPTEALILDKGGWWVMVHDAGGDHAVAVVPGPASGYNTVIRSGLRPGEAVVVTGAYLLYHRGIAAQYQPPD